MHFIEGLPLSHGKSVVLVVVDGLRKMAHFIPLSHPYFAVTVVQTYVEQIFKLHGLPKSFVSDQDNYLSSFYSTFPPLFCSDTGSNLL